MTEFASALAEADQGAAARQLDALFRQLVETADTSNRKGVLTIQMTAVKCAQGQLELSVHTDLKLSKLPPARTKLFVTEGFGLSLEKPGQMSMTKLYHIKGGAAAEGSGE